MPENKTVETDASVDGFLDAVPNERRRADARVVLEMMRRVTGTEPRMWGPSIIGFGKYHYRYESGREGEFLRIGFSPRKANLALYLTRKGHGHADLLARLGKHGTGVSCLYVNRLADVDLAVLESLVASSWAAWPEALSAPGGRS
jgi:hypothetical protein